MSIRIQLFRILHINTTMHAYTINYHCYHLCIAGHKFYCFVDSIDHHREHQGKCSCVDNLLNEGTARRVPRVGNTDDRQTVEAG